MNNLWLLSLSALSSSALGLGLTYTGWRTRRRGFSLAGCCVLVASIAFWVLTNGVEFGVSYALLIPGIIVWCFIARASTQLPAKPTALVTSVTLDWDLRKFCVQLGHTIVVLALCSITSVLVTVGVSFSAPLEQATQAAIAVFLLPTMWAALVFWYLAAQRRLPIVLGCLASSGICLAVFL